jgi:hypothetical protein
MRVYNFHLLYVRMLYVVGGGGAFFLGHNFVVCLCLLRLRQKTI